MSGSLSQSVTAFDKNNQKFRCGGVTLLSIESKSMGSAGLFGASAGSSIVQVDVVIFMRTGRRIALITRKFVCQSGHFVDLLFDLGFGSLAHAGRLTDQYPVFMLTLTNRGAMRVSTFPFRS